VVSRAPSAADPAFPIWNLMLPARPASSAPI
jgi:hypothetical protein